MKNREFEFRWEVFFFISLESPIGYFKIYKVDPTYP